MTTRAAAAPPESLPFGDAAAWRALREQVAPRLRTYPFADVWVAGCGTGERAYALAIVLRECGLGTRARIYATDPDPGALEVARRGIYPVAALAGAAAAYRAGGGRSDLAEYAAATAAGATMRPVLRQAIAFLHHDVTTDASLLEFHAVICGTAVSSLDAARWVRAHEVIEASLTRRGLLALAPGPGAVRVHLRHDYEVVDASTGLYRRAAG